MLIHKDAATQSSIGGAYAGLLFSNNMPPYGVLLHPSPEGYNGCTFITMKGGDAVMGMVASFIYFHREADDPSGVYQLNDENVYQKYYCQSLTNYAGTKYFVSGTLTVTRVDKPWHFRIEIDGVTDDGSSVQGCFDGGYNMFFDYSFD